MYNMPMDIAIWSNLATPVLQKVSDALRMDIPNRQLQISSMAKHVPDDQWPKVLASLNQFFQSGLSATMVATVIDMLLTDRIKRPSAADVIDLVLTGPESNQIASRDTLVVVHELFSEAEKSISVVGYAVHQGEAIFTCLAENMSRKPNLKVEMFLDIQRPKGDTSSEKELTDKFIQRFKQDQWPPTAPIPKIYYFPPSLDHSGNTRACLHAKCVIADRKIAWISSANFTAAAQKRNIEIGVRLRVPSLARRLTEHLEFLKQNNFLKCIT